MSHGISARQLRSYTKAQLFQNDLSNRNALNHIHYTSVNQTAYTSSWNAATNTGTIKAVSGAGQGTAASGFPDGTNARRAQAFALREDHETAAKEAATAQSFQVNREGFYEIHRANGRVEMVAVHADRLESDLTTVPKDTLELWHNTGRGSETTNANNEAASQPRPQSLWRYALLLVLIVAIIESVIASRYLSVEKEAA